MDRIINFKMRNIENMKGKILLFYTTFYFNFLNESWIMNQVNFTYS